MGVEFTCDLCWNKLEGAAYFPHEGWYNTDVDTIRVKLFGETLIRVLCLVPKPGEELCCKEKYIKELDLIEYVYTGTYYKKGESPYDT